MADRFELVQFFVRDVADLDPSERFGTSGGLRDG